MKWFVSTCLELKFLVVLGAMVLLGIGIINANEIPVDVLPESSPVEIIVQTEALGLSAEEIENLVTVNLEEMLTGVPWVESMESKSRMGVSSIKMTFLPGTNFLDARRMVQENLMLVSLIPNVSSPPVILQPTSATNRVMLVGLSSKQLSEIDISLLARWNIGPALLGVPGVANVAIWGEQNRQLQVQNDPERLQENNVSLNQIIETAGDTLWVSPLTYLKASTAGTGGWVDGPNQRLALQHVLPITNEAELAKVNISGDPQNRTLKEVANLREGHQPLIGNAKINNESGIIIMVEKFPNANVTEVSENLEKRLNQLKVGLADLTIDTHIFRPATFVASIISNFGYTLLIGFILVGCLFMLVYSWRIALVSIASLFVSFTTILVILLHYGISLNISLIAGIFAALGIVIDDIVLRAEAAKAHADQAGSEENIIPINNRIFSTEPTKGTSFLFLLIAIATVLPVLLVHGPIADFFQPFAHGYLLSMITILFVGTATAAALWGILTPKNVPKRKVSIFISRLKNQFSDVFNSSKNKTNTPKVITILGIIVGVILWNISTLKLLPSIKDPNILISWETVPGGSYVASEKIMGRLGTELSNLDGIEHVSVHMGRAIGGDEIVGINEAKLFVGVHSKAKYEEVRRNIADIITYYPGAKISIDSYSDSIVNKLWGQDEKDLRVRVYGPEFEILEAEALKIKELVAAVDGVEELEMRSKITKPAIEIEVDLKKAQQYGIKPGDIRRETGILINGLIVGYFFEEQKVFEVVVQGEQKVKESITSLEELIVGSSVGKNIRLKDIANIRVTQTFDIIERESFSRYEDITFEVASGKGRAALKEIDNLLKGLELPHEYHTLLSGEFMEEQESKFYLYILVILVGFLLLLHALLDNWRLSFVVFFLTAFSVGGGVLIGLLFGGGTFVLGSLIGMVPVAGIFARNSVLLLKTYKTLEKKGILQGREIIAQGTQERFIPVLLTTVATSLMLLPIIFMGNSAGNELVHPMAVIIVGGFITSAVITLSILPLMYLPFVQEKK